MTRLISGIHHVTAVSGDAQENFDFYTGALGLRMVKKTVNFEDPGVYHLYFGDTEGNPSTILTTFPYGRNLAKGRHGKGMVNTTAFSLEMGGLDYWLQRLDRFDIAYKHPQERFKDEVFVYLEDPDGLGLELVFSEGDLRKGYTDGSIPFEWAIKGFHHVEIWLEGIERTAALLTMQMNHQVIREGSGRIRLGAEDRPGKYVDLLAMPDVLRGLGGRGTVHHLAFETPDRESQIRMKNNLEDYGLQVTDVKDRKYFSSVYFREPGGVLFEVATSAPGFSVDEPVGSLGQSLMLPGQFEADRERISRLLPEIDYHSGGKQL
ncbi:MAG: diguanylate cyclase [Cytophagaceae bacterium SCN 52-12]|nr:MAG: diguanylate cyclase [Cytophagaceae bacterium SCN 52-12]